MTTMKGLLALILDHFQYANYREEPGRYREEPGRYREEPGRYIE